ncbi:MAG TPA: SLC13 family permease [Luteibacter sp.]|nr:SLC13 family permease [Luteibacter sp.]
MSTDAGPPVFGWWPASLRALRKDHFFLVLLGALVALTVAAPAKFVTWPALVDWPTIFAMAGLLMLTKGVETSGALALGGRWLIGKVGTQRLAAVCLVMLTALLSMLLTNDVALFVVVPLTLGMCRIARMPPVRLIVFEALAVNAGSALTPIGNPQNLFLWQQSALSFGGFVWQMAPLVVVLLLMLLALTALAFPRTPMHVDDAVPSAALDRRLLTVSLALYLPFLVLADMHYTLGALVAVMAVFLWLRRRVLAEIDWGLLVVFVLMFVDLRLLASLDAVRGFIAGLGLDRAPHLFFAGVGLSQFISNVPAAIALAEYSHDWKTIAWGVNVGGFGIGIGSLANLIALRLSGERGAWKVFHAWSIPFVLVAAAVGYLLLFLFAS